MITRTQANEILMARAIERYHEARNNREAAIRAFEAEYGRADRLDHTILADLQRVQARLAAIAARQQRSAGTPEPKVSKHVESIGQLIGSISAFLATERALELFTPVREADYLGWNGKGIGPKGRDDSVLEGYHIVDDPLGAKNATPTADDEGEVCLHMDVRPDERDPTRGHCADCGQDFEFDDSSSAADGPQEAAVSE